MRGPNRGQREEAQLASRLVSDWRDLLELAAIGEALSEIAIAVPDGFGRALLRLIQREVQV